MYLKSWHSLIGNTHYRVAVSRSVGVGCTTIHPPDPSRPILSHRLHRRPIKGGYHIWEIRIGGAGLLLGNDTQELSTGRQSPCGAQVRAVLKGWIIRRQSSQWIRITRAIPGGHCVGVIDRPLFSAINIVRCPLETSTFGIFVVARYRSEWSRFQDKVAGSRCTIWIL